MITRRQFFGGSVLAIVGMFIPKVCMSGIKTEVVEKQMPKVLVKVKGKLPVAKIIPEDVVMNSISLSCSVDECAHFYCTLLNRLADSLRIGDVVEIAKNTAPLYCSYGVVNYIRRSTNMASEVGILLSMGRDGSYIS